MPTINVKVEGLDAMINFTKQVTIRMPIESNKLNEKFAKNTQNQAKRFLKSRYSSKRTAPQTGRLAASILAYQQKPEEWRVRVGGGHIVYAMVQEYGKTWPGRSFVPAGTVMRGGGTAGGGHSGEGISVRNPGASITVPAKHFMEDAAFDTIQKMEKMVEETANKILR